MKNEKQQAAAAAAFAERWNGKGYEKGQSQQFWIDLLCNVFGVEDFASFISFEDQVKLDHTAFIDGYIESTHVMMEQKSIEKDLGSPIKQSDGNLLTPFQQAKRYSSELPYSKRPRWIVTCNFREFWVYDMEQPNGEPEKIFLKDLGKEYYRLQFLVNAQSEHLSKEIQVSMKAGEIVGRIYDALLKQYDDNSPEALRWLNILCVRIVFCLYAEDAGVFRHDQFHDFLASYEAKDMRRALADLFTVLNTPLEKRSRYIADDLGAFPYTNGGLFEEDIEIPQFTEELKQTLLQNASLDFDWSEISPTIFGAVFESTLNPETRRSGGMHYTSIENIHKVIDPLFLNDLRKELDTILEEKVEKTRLRRLDEYQTKLASLTFLDPACGSGNFLTETYLSLRRLENEAIRERYHGQMTLGEIMNPIKVSIHQFYGIEINDFAVTVATTALWISEAQMLNETERIIQHDIDFLPLKSYANIKEGNALRMDWTVWEELDDTTKLYADEVYVHQYLPFEEDSSFVVHEPEIQYGTIEIHSPNIHQTDKIRKTRYVKFDYIMGNPPFVGARLMSAEQKDDLVMVFGPKWKNIGNLDYVTGWYKKASVMMEDNPKLRAALVSTNSITQGEQVPNLWKPLMANGVQIDFAWRTFVWDSESKQKAHVHCVIVGFSLGHSERVKKLYDGNNVIDAKNINAYLIDYDNVFVESRQHPLCEVPEIGIGNKPIDGGFYLFKDDEKGEFVKKEPGSEKYFKRWYGADEFINCRPRWCLWLGEANPVDLIHLPECIKRIEAVREYRLKSPSPGTIKLADKPTRFHVENMPKGNYIVIPQVSSQRRPYIPMGYMDDTALCSDKIRILPEVSLYLFGILESSVHMAWMRTISCRLKSDYSYTVNDIYNTFPWPIVSEKQKAKIEQTAQAILDARSAYPGASLADLYGNLFLFPELMKAHKTNDAAVLEAYGFSKEDKETEIVKKLFKMYEKLTGEKV